jgi:CRP/FNR family cyclic AMP-dependent transcriptional regulator
MMINIDTMLAWGAVYKKIAADEMVFMDGTECHFYYQLASGSLRWINVNDEGKEFIQYMVEPGDCFGELPLFDDGFYAGSAIANTDSIILRLQKNTFLRILKEEPEIQFAFSRLMAERLRFKFMLLQELTCCSPEHSISSLFSHFKATNRNICDKQNQIKLTRQQIADMTGMRVETVIRTIRNLNNKGSLTINRGKILLPL